MGNLSEILLNITEKEGNDKEDFIEKIYNLYDAYIEKVSKNKDELISLKKLGITPPKEKIQQYFFDKVKKYIYSPSNLSCTIDEIEEIFQEKPSKDTVKKSIMFILENSDNYSYIREIGKLQKKNPANFSLDEVKEYLFPRFWTSSSDDFERLTENLDINLSKKDLHNLSVDFAKNNVSLSYVLSLRQKYNIDTPFPTTVMDKLNLKNLNEGKISELDTAKKITGKKPDFSEDLTNRIIDISDKLTKKRNKLSLDEQTYAEMITTSDLVKFIDIVEGDKLNKESVQKIYSKVFSSALVSESNDMIDGMYNVISNIEDLTGFSPDIDISQEKILEYYDSAFPFENYDKDKLSKLKEIIEEKFDCSWKDTHKDLCDKYITEFELDRLEELFRVSKDFSKEVVDKAYADKIDRLFSLRWYDKGYCKEKLYKMVELIGIPLEDISQKVKNEKFGEEDISIKKIKHFMKFFKSDPGKETIKKYFDRFQEKINHTVEFLYNPLNRWSVPGDEKDYFFENYTFFKKHTEKYDNLDLPLENILKSYVSCLIEKHCLIDVPYIKSLGNFDFSDEDFMKYYDYYEKNVTVCKNKLIYLKEKLGVEKVPQEATNREFIYLAKNLAMDKIFELKEELDVEIPEESTNILEKKIRNYPVETITQPSKL